MLKYILFFVFSHFSSVLVAQNTYRVNLKTNLIDEGKIIVWKIYPEVFYDGLSIPDTINLLNSKSTFEGHINYSQQFRINIIKNNKSYITEPFFLDTGFQEIFIDTIRSASDFKLNGYKVCNINSKVSNEYKTKFQEYFKKLNIEIESWYTSYKDCDLLKDSLLIDQCINYHENKRILLRNLKDSLLLEYGRRYPESQIIPWILYDNIKSFGYSHFQQILYNETAKNYVSSDISKYLEKYLYDKMIKSSGSNFELFDFIVKECPDINLSKSNLILVDFWFSNCIPCIRQFPDLLNLYNKYHGKGFDIVGVNNDKKIESLEKSLKNYKLPWHNIWDRSNLTESKIGITVYPSNLLIDNTGKIISTNISITALNEYLDKKLK